MELTSVRAHVVQDLLPYVCFVDDCETPFEMYLTAESLLAHMIAKHSCTRWTCDYCTTGTQTSDDANDGKAFEFTTDKAWQEHMEQFHSKLVPSDKRSMLVELNRRQMIGPLACPLCDTFKMESLDTKIDDHILQHLHEFALWALPEGAEGRDDDGSKVSQVSGTLSHTKTLKGDLEPSLYDLDCIPQSTLRIIDPFMSNMSIWEGVKFALNLATDKKDTEWYFPHLQKVLSIVDIPASLTGPEMSLLVNAQQDLEDALKKRGEFPQVLAHPPVRSIIANDPPLTSRLVRRDDMLDDLEDRLFFHTSSPLRLGNSGQPKQQARLILTGDSGVGKSAIAAHFVHKMREERKDLSTFWINASTRHDVESSFHQCWLATGSPLGPTDDNVHSLLYYLNWTHEKHWLVVFDNVTPHTAQFLRSRGWIPSGLLGCILFTTTDPSGHNLLGPASTIQVPKLKDMELLIAKNTPVQPSGREGFEVAMICTLQFQIDALVRLFDEVWDKHGKLYGKSEGDDNDYVFGRMGQHNVVIALMAHSYTQGLPRSADLVSSFPTLRLALFVGICGGVPFVHDKQNSEILLGDVILSKTFVQHDSGREIERVNFDATHIRKRIPSFQLREEHDPDETLNEEDLSVQTLNVFRALDLGFGLERIRQTTSDLLKLLQSKARIDRTAKYTYPGTSEDILFRANYRHGETIDAIIEGTFDRRSCKEVCDLGSLVKRERLVQRLGMETESLPGVQDPALHIGPVALVNGIIRDGAERDSIAGQSGAIAITSERMAFPESVLCLFIGGICDYADGHQNKTWRHFAAATAASAAKALLELIDSDQQASSSREDSAAQAQPHPLFQALQIKLEDIVKFLSISTEADTRYSEISADVSGIAFQLGMWSRIVMLDSITTVNSTNRETVELTFRTLQRLLDRASDLYQALVKAEPHDLIADVENDEHYDVDSSDDDDR